MFLRTVLIVSVALASLPAFAAEKRPRMVVFEFRAVPDDLRPAAQVVEQVVLTEISRTQRFALLGRGEIVALIDAERQRRLLGCAEDTQCFNEVAHALGARYVVYGALGRLGNTLRFDLKLLDANRATVLASDGRDLQGPEALSSAAKEMVAILLARIGVPLPMPRSPAEASSRVLPWGLTAGGIAGALVGAGLFVSGGSFNELDLPSMTHAQAEAERRSALFKVRMGAGIGGVGFAVAAAGAYLLLAGGAAPAPAVTVIPGSGVSLAARF